MILVKDIISLSTIPVTYMLEEYMSTVGDITCDSYLGHILSNDILSSER